MRPPAPRANAPRRETIARLQRLGRAVFLLLLVLSSSAAAQKDTPGLPGGLDAYIEKAMQAWEVPGLAIAIVKDDKVIFAGGFGVRERGRPERVDENTLFAVASNTKAFTATALGVLVKEGKIAWDDRAIQHLPWLQLYDPYVTRELTVRDMLTHRSGYSTWSGDLIWYGSDLKRDEVLQRVKYLKPATSFRSRYGYSNLMFLAAGEIIPKVTGVSWDDFVKQRLLIPLGMSRTNTSVRDLQQAGNVATPHTKVDGKVTPIPYRNVDNVAPAGAINSSVADWTRWMRMQLGNGMFEGRQIVDPDVIRETRSPQTLLEIGPTMRKLFPSTHFYAYGLGWFLRDYHGRLLVMHDGGMDGMLSQTILVPEEKLGVVVFTNYDRQRLFAALALKIVDHYLGASESDWSAIYLDLERQDEKRSAAEDRAASTPVQGTRPSLSLAQYAGTYRNDMLGTAIVAESEGRLRLDIKGHAGLTGDLSHWHYDTFQAVWADKFFEKSLVTFILNGKGQVEEFRVKVREDFVDPLEYTFKRAP